MTDIVNALNLIGEKDNIVTPKTLLSGGGLIAFIRGGSIMLGTPTAGVCYPYDYISSIGMGGAQFKVEEQKSPFPLFEKCHTIQSVLKNIPDFTEKLARCFIPMKQDEKWLLMNFKTKITSEQNNFLLLDFLIDKNPSAFKGMSFYQRGLAATLSSMMGSANVKCNDTKPCKLEFKYNNKDTIEYKLDSWTEYYDLEKIPLYILFNDPGKNIQLPICEPRNQYEGKNQEEEKISDKIIDACYINCMDDEWAVERSNYVKHDDKTFEDIIYVKTWDMFAELTNEEKSTLCEELELSCDRMKNLISIPTTESNRRITLREKFKRYKERFQDKCERLWINPFKKKKVVITEEKTEDDLKLESIPIVLDIASKVSQKLKDKFVKEEEEEEKQVKQNFMVYYNKLAGECVAYLGKLLSTDNNTVWHAIQGLTGIIGAATIYGIGSYFGLMEKEDQTIQDEEDEEEQYNLKF